MYTAAMTYTIIFDVMRKKHIAGVHISGFVNVTWAATIALSSCLMVSRERNSAAAASFSIRLLCCCLRQCSLTSDATLLEVASVTDSSGLGAGGFEGAGSKGGSRGAAADHNRLTSELFRTTGTSAWAKQHSLNIFQAHWKLKNLNIMPSKFKNV